MLAHLYKKLARFNEVSGVEAKFLQDGSVCFNLSTIRKQKQLLHTVVKSANLSFEELIAALEKDVPVALCLTGKGVLVRQTKGTSGKEDDLLKEIFPNAKEDEFLLDRVEGMNSTFLSLVRKESARELINKFKSHGIYTVHVNPGPGVINDLIPLLNSRNNVTAGNYNIELSGGKLTAITASASAPEELLLGEEEVSSEILLAFAAAFQVLIGSDRKIATDFAESREGWQDKTVFKKLSIGLLIFFVSILFVNLSCFFYLSGKNEELSASSSFAIEEVNFLETLQQEVTEKESFLGQAGWLNFSRTSFFSDQLAATVPDEVTLSELSIHPVDEQASKTEKKLVIRNGTILLIGTCKNPVVLNPWIKELKKLPWIKDVASRSYSYDHKKRAGSFSIKLEVRDETE